MQSVASPGRAASVQLRSLAAVLVAICGVLLTLSVIDEVNFSSMRMGVFLSEQDNAVIIEAVEPDLPAQAAGLAGGDRLLAIEGQPVPTLVELNRVLDQHGKDGEALSLEVERAGEVLRLTLTPGVSADINRLLGQIVLVAAYLGLALLAASHQHKDIRARLLAIFVGIIAIELALPGTRTFGAAAAYGTLFFWMLTTGIQFSLELHMVSLIPSRLPLLKRHPRLVILYYVAGAAASAVLLWLAVSELLLFPDPEINRLGAAEDVMMVGWATLVTLVLVRQLARAGSARERNQTLLVLVGLTPWVVYVLLTTFWSGWAVLDQAWTEPIENIVLLFFPAAVFVAIFRYGLFDVESFVRRSLVYGTVTVLLIVLLYALLTAALPWLSEQVGSDLAHWVITAGALMIGSLFRPLRHGIEQAVEKGLFPERSALRKRLIEIAGALSQENSLEALTRRLASDTRSALHVDWSAVVAIDATTRAVHSAICPDSAETHRARLTGLLDTQSGAFRGLARLRKTITVSRLGKHQPEAARALAAMGAEALVPLYFQRRMIGILCLSTKRSGELYLREELELLDLFSHQIAASLENLRLFQDATYEELTGLLRREAVLRRLQIEAARSARNGSELSVAMIDLDRFKEFNDAHGHLFGDRILEQVASAMQTRVREVDALGRYGGEEFLLVLPNTGESGARRVAEALRQSVSELQLTTPDGQSGIHITISVGIATASEQTEGAHTLARELIRRADAALYAAKRAGRNRVVFHDGSIDPEDPAAV